jgi:hypothetical protein
VTRPTTLTEFAACLREFIRAASSQPDSHTAAPGRWAEAFEQLARALFGLQFAANEPFRRLCQARGVTPERFEHWSQIPAMPTSAFKVLEVTCLPPDARVSVFHSSGTTGQAPSRHFHCAESLAVYEASLLPWFARHLLPDAPERIRMLVLTPPAVQAPQSSLVHMFDTVFRAWAAPGSAFYGWVNQQGGWELDCARLIADLQAVCRQAEPVLLLGTAFNWVHLLDVLDFRQVRLELPPGTRLMETGGYKGRSRALARETLYRLLGDRLGVPPERIVCEYGMCELSSQAYDQVAAVPSPMSATSVVSPTPVPKRRFRFPPWARAMVISPETGLEVAESEAGLIRVYDLANVASVLAVQTEDLGVRRGDGFELMGRVPDAPVRGCSLLAEVAPA